MVGPVAVFALVPRSSERIEVMNDRNNSLPTNDVDYCLILSHVVLHLLLDVGIMLEQVLKVLLAEDEVLLQSSILVHEILVDSLDFSTLLLDFVQSL